MEELLRHFEEVGADVTPILKQIKQDSHTYSQGPAALTRAPQMSSFSTSSTNASLDNTINGKYSISDFLIYA